MEKKENKSIKELKNELWFQIYNSHALFSGNFKLLPIDDLLLIVETYHSEYHQVLVEFLKQPFFIESKNGNRLVCELQQLDEIRIRYESDIKDSHKTIQTLIEHIQSNIKQHNEK